MNERFKELAKQAGLWRQHYDIGEESSAQLEQFAELMVKECVDYIDSRTQDWDAKLRWIFNDNSGYMEVDVDSLLKEHFGVNDE